MPIYKGRRPGTHRVVVWANGESFESVVKGTKKEAVAFEARRRVELEASQPSTRVSPSFADFCETVYAPYAVQHLRGSTWNKVRVYQVATLSKFFGRHKLTDIKPDLIDKYKTHRMPRKAASINNELRVLGTILRFAAERGYPTAKPKWRSLPTDGQARVKAWTAEEVLRLYDAAREKAPEILPLLVFLANTGCRKGEAIACEWNWIDEDAGLIRIPVTEAWRPKSGKAREVPLSNAVRAILSGPRKHEHVVFPNKHGDRYAEFPKDLFAKVREAAGLKGGPHSLRHSYASQFLTKVPDMFLLGQVLGHSTQRVTAIYTHLLPGHLDRAKNAVDLAPRLQTLATTMAKEAK